MSTFGHNIIFRSLERFGLVGLVIHFPTVRVNLISVVAQVHIILPRSDPGKKEYTSAYSIPENNIFCKDERLP
jgi:hypothetical protein